MTLGIYFVPPETPSTCSGQAGRATAVSAAKVALPPALSGVEAVKAGPPDSPTSLVNLAPDPRA